MPNTVSSTLRVASYNLHGLNQGKCMLETLCDNFGIIAVQEHWLGDSDLHNISNFHASFKGFAWSAMSDKLNSGILVGRPFGGLGLLIKNDLKCKISNITIQSIVAAAL